MGNGSVQVRHWNDVVCVPLANVLGKATVKKIEFTIRSTVLEIVLGFSE